MITVKIEGFDSYQKTLVPAIQANLQKKIGSVRDPKTGEPPVVVLRPLKGGNYLVNVEGSPEMAALVQERIAYS